MVLWSCVFKMDVSSGAVHEGHARIKRSVSADKGEEAAESKQVIYEDVSLERGSFLVQQAMRVGWSF